MNRLLRDWPTVVWLLAAVVMTGIHRWVPQSGWLMVHLVLLGALTHAILTWSWFFSGTLLRRPRDEGGAGQQWRLGLLALGAALIFVGYPMGAWPLVAAGATLAGVAVGWHGVELYRQVRRALPQRFAVTVHYYVAAAVGFLTGATLGAVLALPHSDDWHGRLLAAHSLTMLLGWIGPVVLGTLITFWPTLLRTKIASGAERRAGQALPFVVAGWLIVAEGALMDWAIIVLAGLAVWLAAVGWYGRALLGPLRAAPPRHFAAGSVAAALPWLPIALVLGAGQLARVEPISFDRGWSQVAVMAAVGFGLQLLVGALSHLVPAQIGGGSRAVRAGQTELDRWATARLVTVNAGAVLWFVPGLPSWVRVTVSSVVVLAFVVWLVLLVRAVLAMVRTKRARVAGAPLEDLGPERRAFSWPGALAGLLALAVAAGAGFLIDPTALSASTRQEGDNAPVQRVAVVAKDMRFEPASVTITPGTRVVLELRNDDPGMTHDLWLPQGSTPRLAPGQQAELDLGVVAQSANGWCTVAGHKQLGMVFDVVVAGATAQPGHHPSVGAANAQPVRPDPAPPAGFVAFDPALAPLTAETTHRTTLEIVEKDMEVAPGIVQRRWTFNGQVPGPMLHGRVGDVFEVTLVNHGSMGHSVDFHAGTVSPDDVMRTIAPGESLVYRFTAVRSGIWMYHCATVPMTNHIAAGMFGAVVIEPDGLPQVDASYVMLQSEVYVAGDGRTAAEVSGEKVAAERPDLVTFNGYAHQYAFRPLTARVRDRVRIWVLDIGPNRASSFHVVGSQFHTVWFEGRYLLDERVDRPGGSQALGMQAAQGGFVEMTFDEPGRYTFVNHIMVDAERGARGHIDVTAR